MDKVFKRTLFFDSHTEHDSDGWHEQLQARPQPWLTGRQGVDDGLFGHWQQEQGYSHGYCESCDRGLHDMDAVRCTGYTFTRQLLQTLAKYLPKDKAVYYLQEMIQIAQLELDELQDKD